MAAARTATSHTQSNRIFRYGPGYTFVGMAGLSS
jgi:hypothetical protein